MAARLMRSAADLGLTILTDSPALRLLTKGDAGIGAVPQQGGQEVTIDATCGMVLATGGFPHDPSRRATLGQTARSGAWRPVSTARWDNGRVAAFPHIIDRGKPGIIAVLPDGRRFCNEGLRYHDFVTALLEATPPGQTPQAWLIVTRKFQRRYGLGGSRPFPVPLRPWLRRGHLTAGQTSEALAKACGIDPALLRQTRQALDDSGISVNDIEFVRLTPAFDAQAQRPFLDAGATLGARHVICAPYDPDLSRLAANLAAFHDLAQQVGLSCVLEFFAWTEVPDLRTANRVVDATG